MFARNTTKCVNGKRTTITRTQRKHECEGNRLHRIEVAQASTVTVQENNKYHIIVVFCAQMWRRENKKPRYNFLRIFELDNEIEDRIKTRLPTANSSRNLLSDCVTARRKKDEERSRNSLPESKKIPPKTCNHTDAYMSRVVIMVMGHTPQSTRRVRL